MSGQVFATIARWGAHGAEQPKARFVIRKMQTFLARRLKNIPEDVLAAVIQEIATGGKHGEGDGVILAKIAKMCAPYRSRSEAKEKGRAASRIADVAPALWQAVNDAETPEIRQYLDVGCAEGRLTTAFGSVLNLGKSDIHGCDVIPIHTEEFVFTLASSDNLPYADGQFQVETLIMSLHHFQNPEASLAEVGRVLSPGGILVIREHDCKTEEFGVFLDLVHYMYGIVLGDEVTLRFGHENEDLLAHIGQLTATYHTKEYWTQKITKAGFTLLQYSSPVVTDRRGTTRPRPDMFDSYYALYRK